MLRRLIKKLYVFLIPYVLSITHFTTQNTNLSLNSVTSQNIRQKLAFDDNAYRRKL